MKTDSWPRIGFKWIRDYIEDVLALFIVAGVSLWGWFIDRGVLQDVPLLISGVTTILILIVIAHWRDRKRYFQHNRNKNDDIYNAIINRTISKEISADEFFGEIDEYFSIRGETIDEALTNASTITICGRTLTGSLRTHASSIRSRLEVGGSIKVLMVDHNRDDVLDELVKLSYSKAGTKDNYRSLIEFNAELLNNLGVAESASGSLEIGYLPFVPGFGMTLIETGQEDDFIFVEIYQHLVNSSPGFKIDRTKAPRSFKGYKTQIEKMWRECRIEKIL